MQKKGHPNYRKVLFVDSSTGYKVVYGSSLETKEMEEFEGQQYPVYRVAVSSASHPAYTGSEKFVDAEGRIDKFRKRYQRKEKK